MGKQLILNLSLPPATYSRDDFVVTEGNREALAWVDRWPDWPAPALSLFGPAGCGKTHLARIWLSRSAAVTMDATMLHGKSIGDLVEVVAASPNLVVEAAELAPERMLLHLYNLIRERHGHMLLTSPKPPAHWSIALPDLASRLRAAPVVGIAPPDDELLGSIILKELADRQLHAGVGVVQYLVSHMERSGEAARYVVAALDRRALAERREIDRRLAIDVLAEIAAPA